MQCKIAYICVVRESVVVMRKIPFKSMEQQPGPVQDRRTKPLLLIRPRSSSLEMDTLIYRKISPVRTPAFRSSLRIALNLFGVLVVVVTAGFLFWNASINAHPESGSVITRMPVSPGCAGRGHCAGSLLRAATLTSQTTQMPSPSAPVTAIPALMPTIIPTSTPKLAPDPTLPPTVTPVSAYLTAAPITLTLSLVSNCLRRQPVILLLTDAGGTPLVWFQDTAHSSHGISIADPTKTHLLQPGMSVNATVNCLTTLVVGLYTLAIDYNGGTLHVAVKIIL